MLQALRANLRLRHFSARTEEAYSAWARRYVRFHGLRHPGELGEADVRAFLTHLAVDRQLGPSTLAQALAALLFLYREVLGRPLVGVGSVPRARVPTRIPVVLTPEEVRLVLEQLRGTTRLAAMLLYGVGMRLLECLTLRVKDIDLVRGEIRIRRGKGARDRVTVLPEVMRAAVAAQVERLRMLHQRDCEGRGGWVELPGALARKYPRAGRSLQWQWLFPASRQYTDRTSGERRRHHLHESALQRGMAEAVRRSGITKRATCHTFRHSAAMALLQHGVDRSVIALWLGHESVETTQMYLHANLQLKEAALARTAPLNVRAGRYRPGDSLLAFLKSL
ncbi:MAG: integron integrase [Gemmatimonadetes bacterium]|nr:integron integrase [Gemmatimonadota bacterium]